MCSKRFYYGRLVFSREIAKLMFPVTEFDKWFIIKNRMGKARRIFQIHP